MFDLNSCVNVCADCRFMSAFNQMEILYFLILSPMKLNIKFAQIASRKSKYIRVMCKTSQIYFCWQNLEFPNCLSRFWNFDNCGNTFHKKFKIKIIKSTGNFNCKESIFLYKWQLIIRIRPIKGSISSLKI